MTVINKIILSEAPPQDTNVGWLKPEGSNYILSFFGNGQWKSTNGETIITKPEKPVNLQTINLIVGEDNAILGGTALLSNGENIKIGIKKNIDV